MHYNKDFFFKQISSWQSVNCSNSTNLLLNSRGPSTRVYVTVATRSVLMRKECQCGHLSSFAAHSKHGEIEQSKGHSYPHT